MGREQERKREKARVPWVECVREVGLNIYIRNKQLGLQQYSVG